MQIIISEFTSREISTVNKCLEHLFIIDKTVVVNVNSVVLDVYEVKVCRAREGKACIELRDCEGNTITTIPINERQKVIFSNGMNEFFVHVKDYLE